jgi:signal transduction histidine kinase
VALAASNDFGWAPELDRALVQSAKPLVLGQLARGVAHEIGNPLCAALGLIELLLADDALTPASRELAVFLEESCGRIQAIVSGLGGFVREDVEEFRTVSLADLVDETVELVGLTTTAKDVEIVKRFSGEPFEVEARPARVKQILLNVLLNAQQAMPSGGRATIELARETEWIEASVSDTGPGIHPDLRERVFEPFFTTSVEREHVGLGLPVARALARLHGGDLRVTAQPGKGARFTLALPAKAKAAA